jgi:small subunit ribosomal protein S9
MATSERWYATGRRKEATARVYLSPGTGKVIVNKREAKDYFKRDTLLMIMGQPFEVVDGVDQYDVNARVDGGGLSGQADAVKHGVSRALVESNPEFRAALKKAGFLTRDARVVERKKYGQPGARKRFQFSKR